MDRLRVDAARFLDRIERVERRIAQVIKQVAMQRIHAGFGDGVHDPAGSLAQLRAVIARADLKFLDRIHAVDIGNRRAALGLGEERLAVICAVDGTLIVEP